MKKLTASGLAITVIGGISTFIAYDYFVKPFLDEKLKGTSNDT